MTTSILTPQLLYGDSGFLDWIVRLQPFHSETGKPPMTANQFYWGTRLQMECGLRISECLNLIKEDFDLDHRLLTIRNPKTGHVKSKMKSDGTFIEKIIPQKTTILPCTIKRLERFLNKFSDNERIFPTTRGTMWRYYKNTSTIAGIDIFTVRESQTINGAWTHMMRNSCSRMYKEAGASEEIINKKLRWKPSSMQQRYNRVEITDVLKFDEIHFSEGIERYFGSVEHG